MSRSWPLMTARRLINNCGKGSVGFAARRESRTCGIAESCDSAEGISPAHPLVLGVAGDTRNVVGIDHAAKARLVKHTHAGSHVSVAFVDERLDVAFERNFAANVAKVYGANALALAEKSKHRHSVLPH